METVPASASASGPSSEKVQLPKLSMFERIVRLVSIPASFLVGVHFFRSMSRDGLQDIFDDRGQLDALKAKFNESYRAAHAKADTCAVRKEMKGMVREFDDGVTKIFKEDGFRHSLDYFLSLDRRKQMNIAITFGAATSIALGFFAMVGEPRNRAAIYDLFRKVDKHAKDKEQNQR